MVVLRWLGAILNGFWDFFEWLEGRVWGCPFCFTRHMSSVVWCPVLRIRSERSWDLRACIQVLAVNLYWVQVHGNQEGNQEGANTVSCGFWPSQSSEPRAMICGVVVLRWLGAILNGFWDFFEWLEG